MRIGYHEAGLRERAKALGGVWRPAQKVWELTRDAVRKLGISDRLADGPAAKAVQANCAIDGDTRQSPTVIARAHHCER